MKPAAVAMVHHDVGTDIDPEHVLRVAQSIIALIPWARKPRLSAGSYSGRIIRSQAYSDDRLRKLLERSDLGDLSVEGPTKASGDAELGFYLRHNAAIELEYQPPGTTYLAMTSDGRDVIDVRHVVTAFLRGANDFGRVLHGGACILPTLHMARTEATRITMSSEQPPAFVERIGFDAFAFREIWTHARRAYPVTLLGAEISAEVGGADAVRATGVAQVEELGGTLLITVTEHLTDPLDTEFRRASKAFRQLLWPHTIQNPAEVDAADA